jgi:putative NADPH-quinone reductase
MKVLIVLAHPEPKSFNTAIYNSTIALLEKQGHEVKTSSLYAMKFNPVSDRKNFTAVKDASFLKLQLEEVYAAETGGFADDINEEQEKVAWCDLMIWQFPLWWFALPAILKGWVDRVFAMGRFYGSGKFYEEGMCKGKKALLSTTTGGPVDAYLKDGFNGDINTMLKPIHRGILEFSGFTVLAPQINYSVAHLTDSERKAQIENWNNRLQNIFEEERWEVGQY